MGRGYRLQLLSSTFSLAFSPPSTFCHRFGTFLRHRLLMLTLPLSLRPRFGFPPRLRCRRLTICLFLHCQCGGQPIHLCLLSRRCFSVSMEPSLLSWYRSGLGG